MTARLRSTPVPLQSLATRLLLLVVPVVVGGCASTGNPDMPGSMCRRKGIPWTIRCLEIQGPHGLQLVEQFAETMKRTSGIRPRSVFVRDDPDGVARLYYGVYYRRTDPKTGKRPLPRELRKDIKLIRELGDASGKPVFVRAMPVGLPIPDVGNPDWILKNVQSTYSLQVAVFVPTDTFWEFKKAAAELCNLFREKGYEAYYHHADSASVVTVGSFGPDAVITRIQNGKWETFYSSEVLVLQREDLLKHNLLNGSIYRARNDRGKMTPVPSRLVKIPHAAEDELW